MVGREAVIEKVTWQVFLGNNVSQETGQEDVDDILFSLLTLFC